MCFFTYKCMYVCMYICMDGWILTVDLLPVRWPDPGTPLPAGEGTVLPTGIQLTSPGRIAHRAPRLQAAWYEQIQPAQPTRRLGENSV